jgi:glycosyltransferase involved in cell wall biosynthesis
VTATAGGLRSPRRVLFLVGKFMAGGTEQHVLRVLEGLDRTRVRPVVGMLTASDLWFDRFRALDVPYEVLGLELRPVDPRYLGPMMRLARFVRRHGVEIVHAYGWEMQMLACWLKILAPGVRLVGTRRTVAELQPAHHLTAYRLVNRLFAKTVAVSETARRSAIDAEGLHPARIVVIPNGVDPTRLPSRPEPGPPSPLRVGTVANVKRRKGYFWAVEGLAELARRGVDFEYHVIGRSDTGDELPARVRALGIEKRVVWHGQVDDPGPLVARLHVFLFPTYHEGMSNALLEAMMIGVPPLATNISANCDMIRDGIDGLLIAPEDTCRLADRLEWGARHPLELEALGQAARRRSLEEFSLARMLHAMESLYQELAA